MIIYENDGLIDDEFDEIDELGEAVYDVKIKVFGIGGGGCNALEHMAQQGVEGVEYVAVNTDVPALRAKDKNLMQRVQIGKKRTKGRGAGGNPEVGSESAREDRAIIEKSLEDTTMVFISAGMGGGTGTGAAPVIAEIARELEILTVGIVTKPFDFERQSRMNTALKGIAEMRKHVDALIVIPNQKLLTINERAINAKAAFKMVDDVLYKVVKSISELLHTTSEINVDFADLSSILENSGIAHIAIGMGAGDNKVEEAVTAVVNSPLLETSIQNAGKMLVHITISEDGLLQDVHGAVDKLSNEAYPDVDVKFGYRTDPDLKDTIIATVIATDFQGDEDRAPSPSKAAAREPALTSVTREPTRQSASSDPFAKKKIDVDTVPVNSDLGAFITQNLSGETNKDPFEDVMEIFRDRDRNR